MDVVVWLRSLGLGQYEKVFRENEIDEAVLPNLTAEDLKELGVAALGHRRKLLDAIAALRGDANATPAAIPRPPALDASPRDTAERRQVTVMFSDLVGSTALSARMDERQLLRYYGERERVISGPQRGPAHQLLWDLGYIKEQPVNLQELLIVVMERGRKILSSAP